MGIIYHFLSLSPRRRRYFLSIFPFLTMSLSLRLSARLVWASFPDMKNTFSLCSMKFIHRTARYVCQMYFYLISFIPFDFIKVKFILFYFLSVEFLYQLPLDLFLGIETKNFFVSSTIWKLRSSSVDWR